MGDIAEQFEKRFVDFLNEQYADKPGWSDPDFHRYSNLPPEFQYLVAMSYLEQQTSNGSLAQAFWNSYPNHMVLLKLSGDGYRMIGANAQTQAMPRLVALFQEWGNDAEPYMRRDIEGDDDAFGDWCAKGYLGSGKGLDEIYCLSGEENSAYSIREKWVEKHIAILEAQLASFQKQWWQIWKS